ncbi:MAG: TolC family protein [Rudaea sp.]|uniref:TolC family protein n=1 Tax=unclassified Rudaea TaxID=2627037 RepID=UPI00148551A3|nr:MULTISPECIES: TolC family protein [unclassified Rudaea]MBN8888470.1 TolC family protein [Rudaea sp.]
MRRAILRVAFAGASILFPTWLLAQPSGPLSLEEAVRIAEGQAPAIAARRAAADSATQAIGPAGELPDPELIAGIDNLPVNKGDAFSLTDDFMTMRKVGVMQSFPRREKREARTQRAQAAADREQALLTNERLAVREGVAKAWIARQAVERRLELLTSLRPRAQAQVGAAAAALSAGRASAADGIAAEATRVMLEDRIDQAQREVDEARAEFGRWLPEARDRTLGEAPNFDDLGRNPDTLLAHIGEHRELLAFDAAEHAASSEVALARAEKKPDWSLEFDYAQRGPRYSNMISLELRVPLPLFASRRQDPLIASKQAALMQVQAERADAVRMHSAELTKTLAAWRSAVSRAQRYEKELLPLGDARADAALAAYRGGRGDAQAALSALDSAVEQRVAYTELLNTLGQTWATLRFAYANHLEH